MLLLYKQRGAFSIRVGQPLSADWPVMLIIRFHRPPLRLHHQLLGFCISVSVTE